MRPRCEWRKYRKPTCIPIPRACLDSLQIPRSCFIPPLPRCTIFSPLPRYPPQCTVKRLCCLCTNQDYCTKEKCQKSEDCQIYHPSVCPYGVINDTKQRNELGPQWRRLDIISSSSEDIADGRIPKGRNDQLLPNFKENDVENNNKPSVSDSPSLTYQSETSSLSPSLIINQPTEHMFCDLAISNISKKKNSSKIPLRKELSGPMNTHTSIRSRNSNQSLFTSNVNIPNNEQLLNKPPTTGSYEAINTQNSTRMSNPGNSYHSYIVAETQTPGYYCREQQQPVPETNLPARTLSLQIDNPNIGHHFTSPNSPVITSMNQHTLNENNMRREPLRNFRQYNNVDLNQFARNDELYNQDNTANISCQTSLTEAETNYLRPTQGLHDALVNGIAPAQSQNYPMQQKLYEKESTLNNQTLPLQNTNLSYNSGSTRSHKTSYSSHPNTSTKHRNSNNLSSEREFNTVKNPKKSKLNHITPKDSLNLISAKHPNLVQNKSFNTAPRKLSSKHMPSELNDAQMNERLHFSRGQQLNIGEHQTLNREFYTSEQANQQSKGTEIDDDDDSIKPNDCCTAKAYHNPENQFNLPNDEPYQRSQGTNLSKYNIPNISNDTGQQSQKMNLSKQNLTLPNAGKLKIVPHEYQITEQANHQSKGPEINDDDRIENDCCSGRAKQNHTQENEFNLHNDEPYQHFQDINYSKQNIQNKTNDKYGQHSQRILMSKQVESLSNAHADKSDQYSESFNFSKQKVPVPNLTIINLPQIDEKSKKDLKRKTCCDQGTNAVSTSRFNQKPSLEPLRPQAYVDNRLSSSRTSKRSAKRYKAISRHSSKASQITCLCPEDSKDNWAWPQGIECQKSVPCMQEVGSTACSSVLCIVNESSGCKCRYPPAFRQLSCAGNINGTCNCNENNKFYNN